jgi:signal transduction histidine kinase
MAEDNAMETCFAPAERADAPQLAAQIRMIAGSELLNSYLSLTAGILVVLNEQRQIVGLNHIFLDLLGIDDAGETMGLRLGESLGCVNAETMPGGCGTGKPCASCGAVIAMMATLESNKQAERICALETNVRGGRRNLALEVRTSPLQLDGQRFIIVAVRDVTREQLQANLERVFYHDINNILGTLLGPSEMLRLEMPQRWEVVQIHEAAIRLCREIELQRELSLFGSSGFTPHKREVLLSDIAKDVDFLIGSHVAAKGRNIQVIPSCDDCVINTDKTMLNRVLTNMLLNALEATQEGGLVRFATSRGDTAVTWEVWNDTAIDESIQPRIFQRHFSTKDSSGRGFGTFSMKLFGEHYLGGKIAFTSSPAGGTLFTFTLPLS